MGAITIDEQLEEMESQIEGIYALRGAGGRDVEAVLIEGVADASPAIRKAALEVLGELFDPRFEAALRNALADEDDDVRAIAARSLRLLENGVHLSARPSVEECLNDLDSPRCHVREQALQALKGISDDRVVEKAVVILKGDNSKWCRISAAGLLEGIHTKEVVEAQFAVLGEDLIGELVAHQLARRSEESIDKRLLEHLMHGKGILRLNVASGVGSGRDMRACPFLATLVNATDERTAEAAIISLSRLYHRQCQEPLAPATFEFLVPVLENASRAASIRIKAPALELLCHLNREIAAPLAREAILSYSNRLQSGDDSPLGYDSEWGMIDSALRILNLPGSSSWLWPLLNTEDLQIRTNAASLMLDLGDERGRAELEELLEAPDLTVRAQAAMALVRSGDSDVWDLLAALLPKSLDNSWRIKIDILEALTKSDESRAVPLFIDILEKPDLYQLEDEDFGWVITQLGKFGSAGAVETLGKWRHRNLINCDEHLVEKALAAIQGT